MYLLDTNVVSELRKIRAGKADLAVASWAESVGSTQLYLSVITVQELEIGVMLMEQRDKAAGAVLRAWLDQKVMPEFTGRILPVDIATARRSATLHVPKTRPFRDSLIAATALLHGMTIVTRNVADFDYAGGTILNPWNWRAK